MKKKKKTSRIGFARDETLNEEESGDSLTDNLVNAPPDRREEAFQPVINTKLSYCNDDKKEPDLSSQFNDDPVIDSTPPHSPTSDSAPGFVTESVSDTMPLSSIESLSDLQVSEIEVEKNVEYPAIHDIEADSVIYKEISDNGYDTDLLTSDMTKTDNKSTSSNHDWQECVLSMQYDIMLLFQEDYMGYRNIIVAIENSSTSIGTIEETIRSLEQRQMTLASNEDFDEADAINDQITEFNSKLEAIKNERKAMSESLDTKVRLYHEKKISAMRKLDTAVRNIEGVKEKLQDKIEELSKSKDEIQSIDFEKLKAEQERIDLEESQCQREMDSLDSDFKVIENSIVNQTSDCQDRKQILQIALVGVQAEIRELEQILAVKRTKESELEKELDYEDKKISEIRKKYDRQLQRITDRKDILVRAENEISQDKSLISKEKSAVDEKLSDLCKRIESLRYELNTVDDRRQAIEIFVEDLMDDSSFRVDFSSTFNDFSVSSASSDDFADVEKRLHDTQSQQLYLQLQLDELSLKIQRINDDIPKLETDKKLHASAKRFKEAAQVQKDLKDLTSQRDSLIKEFDALSESQQSGSELIRHLEEERSDKLVSFKENQRSKIHHAMLSIQNRLRTNLSKFIAIKDLIDCEEENKLTPPLLSLYKAESTILQDELNILKSKFSIQADCDNSGEFLTDSLNEKNIQEDCIGI